MMKRYLIAMLALTLVGIAVAVCAGTATNALSVTTSLQVDNGEFKLLRQVNNYKVNQAAQALDYGIQTTTNSVTNSLNIANVTVPHYCFFRNLDETNVAIFVTLTLRLEPGDVAVLPVANTNMTTYTTNGSTKLEYFINQK